MTRVRLFAAFAILVVSPGLALAEPALTQPRGIEPNTPAGNIVRPYLGGTAIIEDFYPRFEAGAFLGWPVDLDDPILNPFNQVLQRGAALNGGAQLNAAWQVGHRWPVDVRFGGRAFFSDSDAESIRNLLVPGALLVNGEYRTLALLATIGLGFQLFDRWSAVVDFGGGIGFNKLLIRNAATGGAIVDNDATVGAWMVSGSLLYALTDDLRLGLFLAYLATQSMNAQVITTGTPFSMGGLRNVVAGITLAYAFAQSSRRLDRNLPSLR